MRRLMRVGRIKYLELTSPEKLKAFGIAILVSAPLIAEDAGSIPATKAGDQRRPTVILIFNQPLEPYHETIQTRHSRTRRYCLTLNVTEGRYWILINYLLHCGGAICCTPSLLLAEKSRLFHELTLFLSHHLQKTIDRHIHERAISSLG